MPLKLNRHQGPREAPAFSAVRSFIVSRADRRAETDVAAAAERRRRRPNRRSWSGGASGPSGPHLTLLQKVLTRSESLRAARHAARHAAGQI